MENQTVENLNKSNSGNGKPIFRLAVTFVLLLAFASAGVFFFTNRHKEKYKKELISRVDDILNLRSSVLDGQFEFSDGALINTDYKGVKKPDSEKISDKYGLYSIFKSTGIFTVRKLTKLNDDEYVLEEYTSRDLGFKKPEFNYHSPRYIDDFMGGKIQMDAGYKTKNARSSVRECYQAAFDYFTKFDKKSPGSFEKGKYDKIATFSLLKNDYYTIKNTFPENETPGYDLSDHWIKDNNEESVDFEEWVVFYKTEGWHYQLILNKEAYKKDITKNAAIALGAVVLIFMMLLAFKRK